MEGVFGAGRGFGEGTSDSPLNIALEATVCDEFREAQNWKGRCVSIGRVFDERLSAVLVQDEYVPVVKKEAVPDSLYTKYEFVDGEQVWSKSVLRSKDRLEEDLKMPGQKILLKTSCGSSGAATAAANGGEGPVCDEEELHMQPCPEKGLQAELKQEPKWEGEHFDYPLPLLGSVDQGLEFPLGMVSEEHRGREGSARVEESFDASVKAERTSVAAAANAVVGPLCKEEEVELHLQPCPAGDPEKGLWTKLKQEGEPLTPRHPLSGSAEGSKIQCVWSMATKSEKVGETLRHHRGSLEDGGVQSNEQFCPPQLRASRRLREKTFTQLHTPQGHQCGKKPLSCDEYGNSFPKLSKLKMHQRVHTEEKPHSCEECGKSFAHLSLLERHQRVHTGEKPHSCEECGRSFALLCNLERHQMVHTGEKPHSCDECGKSFTHRFNLKSHQRVHTGEKPHSCEECGKSFARLSHLKSHRRVHTGEKPHSCEECGRSFADLFFLKSHQRVHTGEKLHSCDKCGKSFALLCNLKRHQMVHSGEKPHSCDECGRSFAHRFSLKSHQRLHAGEKPHNCDNCGKSFARLSHLKSHQRVHTEEKPHSCEECGKSFARLRLLERHQRVHTGEKPHSCDECGKSFTQLGTLKTHQQLHTREKVWEELCPSPGT